MNRIKALALAWALVGLAALTTAHEADSGIQFANGEVFLRHHGPHTDHEGGTPTEYPCSSTAADTYAFTGSDYCNTGDHRTAGGAITMGFSMSQPGLTGMLEHVLSHSAGEVRFNCSWDDGAFTGCRVVEATWPAPGADFCHELWGHAGPPGLDPYVPNTPPCATTIGSAGLVVTTNAPAGGTGKPIGQWGGSFSHG